MTRWLLNTFPTWALFLIVVGIFVLWGGLGVTLVRRRWPGLSEGGHNELAGVLVGLVVGVYGIMLAFVIVALYEGYNDTEGAVRDEATELAQIYRSSEVFPPTVKEPIHAGLRRYVEIVTGEERTLLADGKESLRAWREVDGLYRTLQGYDPRRPSEVAFYDSVVAELNEFVRYRRDRLDHARESLPGVFQVLIFGGGFLLIGFLFFMGAPSARAQTTMVVAVSALIGLNILIAILLDHPFTGDVTVSDAPFRAGTLADLLRSGP